MDNRHNGRVSTKQQCICVINIFLTFVKIEKYLICLITLLSCNAFSQDIVIDSLLNVLKTTKEDTSKINTLNELSKITRKSTSNYDTALSYSYKAKLLAQQINYERGIAESDNNTGMIFFLKGDFPQALNSFLSALSIYSKTENNEKVAEVYNNLGILYFRLNDFNKSYECHTKALKLRIMNGYDKLGIAQSYNNIGLVSFSLGRLEEAYDYFNKSLEICKELGNKYGISYAYFNIGEVFQGLGNYHEAINYSHKALEIQNELNLRYEIANTCNSLGGLYLKINDYKKAQEYISKSNSLSHEIKSNVLLKSNYLNQYKLDSVNRNFRNAFENYKIYTIYRDSLINKENTKQIVQQQMQFEFDIKQTADSLRVAEERKIVGIKFEQEKKLRLYLYGGIALLCLFSIFVFNRFLVTKKQKKIITLKELETQNKNQIIEEKNKTILESINYALYIQRGILPSRNILNTYLQNGFLLYKPKDIISGDFYWIEAIDQQVLFAVADCTGHGVPGAMVSIVCSNALNRTVKEFGITDPGKILDKTRELVIETFAKSEIDIKDGMDISLCTLNTQTNHFQWSGANNPLWYISGNTLNEIKGDKQPIGKIANPKPFTTHSIHLQKDDTIYIFTDGYADQFGGEKDRKFMYKPLKYLLTEIHHEPLEIQREILEQKFASWKGDKEQTDDVLIIGLRI
jgi:serine phosphatase RsbU (regulator of sigma subunit)/Tfp pilus assembly protein PilF